jgi:hypothetical protein
MTAITKLPVRQPVGGITGRDGYLIAQALIYAIEIIAALPEWRQEKSNQQDMRLLLTAMLSEDTARHMTENVRWHLFNADRESTSA